MHEKEIGAASSARDEKASLDIDIDDGDHSSISSASTDSVDSIADIQSIHQTLSRNAGLDEPEKSLAQIHTVPTNMTTDPAYELDFDENGENPKDWGMAKKGMVIGFMSYSTLVVVMYSTSYTSGMYVILMHWLYQTASRPLPRRCEIY